VTGPAEVITAVPTPFTESGDLDLAAARELFDFVARTTGRMLVAAPPGSSPPSPTPSGSA
jgi:4-hydroxy-tetrahydrodipicolinate synthase